jgi:flagellar motility protein MotE (MotC chaperone)
MHNTNFEPYQAGFQRAYQLAQKLISIKSFPEQKVSAHIDKLSKIRIGLSKMIEICVSLRSKEKVFWDQMDSADNMLKAILDGEYASQLSAAYSDIHEAVDYIYTNDIKNLESIYELPEFEWADTNGHKYSFEYIPPDHDNGPDAIENSCESIKKSIEGLSYSFDNKDLTEIIGLARIIRKEAAKVSAQNSKASNQDYMKNPVIEETITKIMEKSSNISDYAIDDILTIEEESDYLLEDIADIIKQYADYMHDSKDEYSSTTRLSSGSTTSQSNSSSSSLQDKYRQLMESKKKSITRVKKLDVSHIVNRAIAQLGK